MYQHILIATDGSELSRKAAHHGLLLAKSTQAKVTALTVVTLYRILTLDPDMVTDAPEDYKRHMARLASLCLDQVTTQAAALGVACETLHVEHLHPYRAILDTATTLSCDLVVMASHGRRGIAAVVLGSETVKVLTHSTIPVLVYREG